MTYTLDFIPRSFILMLSAACIGLVFCGEVKPGGTIADKPDGRALAEIYCTGCHVLPEPKNLDRKTWEEYVLPRMGYMYGHYSSPQERAELLEAGPAGLLVQKAKVFPEKPTLDSSIWLAIQDYYLSNAPEVLPRPELPSIQMGLDHFQVVRPEFKLSPPSSTMARFVDGSLFIGDALSKRLYQFDEQLQLVNAANVREGAVWLNDRPEELLVTVMGSFSPTDAPSGFLLELPKSPGRKPRVLIGNLQRPVHTELGDLNGDGREDAVICEFAKWTGSLSWWEKGPVDSFTRHILRDEPGATRAYIRDLNKDGLPDVAALFGQGGEGIYAYYNEGDGKFREEPLLQFPSSYGSSYFNFFDYNGDEHPDIIYTCGDNADYPPILKPYHGIRIFQNDGNNGFEEVFFYPLNGAYGAVPADFDQDGDLDLAAISFFPDFPNRPEESFLYLENQGDMTFTASTFEGVNDGRWIVMDGADYDRDGDLDLVLGALTFEVVPKMGLLEKWVEKGLPFVILENTAVK